MKSSQILQDYFTAELVWKKKKVAPLWNRKDVERVRKLYHFGGPNGCKDIEIDVPIVSLYHQQPEYMNLSIHTYFHNKFNHIIDILNLAPHNLFLCGGAVIDIIRGNEIHDFDIYFCCKDYKEGEEILEKCLKFLSNTPNTTYVINQHVVTVELGGWHEKIQFIRRIYERPDQILMGFDIWACKHGWNPTIGYFTIPTGAISCILNMFPIDITTRSMTFGSRVTKYIRKWFDIWLPGIDRHYNKEIVTPDFTLALKCKNSTYYRNVCKIKCDLRCVSSCEHSIDYNKIPTMLCTRGCSSTVYRLHDVVDHSPNWRYDSDARYNTENLEKGRYFSFSLNYNNYKDVFWPTLNEVSKNRYFLYLPQIEEQMKILRDPTQRWKTGDPGSQNFGRFNPIIEIPSKWYGFERNYFVGILPEIYVALRNCWKSSSVWKNVPKDIFKMLCDYILEANNRSEF